MKRVRLLLAVPLFLSFTACGLLAKFNSEPLVITGTLSPEMNRSVSMSRSISSAITHIAAIPVVLLGSELEIQTQVPVLPNGSFELPFSASQSGDTLLLTINENAQTPLERSNGFIALQNGSGINLAALPLNSVTEDINLGDLDFDPVQRESLSSLSSIEQSRLFNATPDQLLDQIFRTNGAKNIINLYSNLRPTRAGEFRAGQEVNFESPLDLAVNQWSDHLYWLNTPYRFNKINFRMEVPDEDIDYTRVANEELFLLLTPSFPVSPRLEDKVFDPDNPIRYGGGWIDGGSPDADFSVFGPDDGGPPDGGIYLTFDFFNDVQPGVWILEIENGRQLAIADTGSFLTQTPDGVFIYPLPRLNITTDEADKVTAVQLEFYRFTPNANGYQIIPESLWNNYFTNLSLNLNYDIPGPNENEWLFGNDVKSFYEPVTDLYVIEDPEGAVPSNGYRLSFIGIRYENHGFGFDFRFAAQGGSLVMDFVQD